MTMFNAANTPAQVVVSQVQTTLMQIADAMAAAERLGSSAAAIALSDLTAAPPNGPGMPTADAQAVLSAAADAAGFAALYNTGTDSRNPGAGYPYGASQKIVIGFRTR